MGRLSRLVPSLQMCRRGAPLLYVSFGLFGQDSSDVPAPAVDHPDPVDDPEHSIDFVSVTSLVSQYSTARSQALYEHCVPMRSDP